MKIIISRTDSIGDVILTLPMCGWIKQNIPKAEIIFLCQKLTLDIVRHSKFIDLIHEWDGTLPQADCIIHVFPKREVAKEAKRTKIKIRVGTSHRWFHLFTCNKLINFSRMKSDYHESQLNFRLLKGIGYDVMPGLDRMAQFVGWENSAHSRFEYLQKEKFNIIFHIKSRGSAKEWKSTNYYELATQLSADRYNIILTGTEKERALIADEIPQIFALEHVTDSTGQLSLEGLIQLIGQSDGLLACSTGPLHIAGVSNIRCLGLYPDQRPMHAGRWGPLGDRSEYLEEQHPSTHRFLDITVEDVLKKISVWL